MAAFSDSLDADNHIDQLCDRFEQQWLAGETPRIEAVLSTAHGVDREKLFRHLLLVELEVRLDQGQHPSAEEYGSRFPEFSHIADEVHASAIAKAGVCIRVGEDPALIATGAWHNPGLPVAVASNTVPDPNATRIAPLTGDTGLSTKDVSIAADLETGRPGQPAAVESPPLQRLGRFELSDVVG